MWRIKGRLRARPSSASIHGATPEFNHLVSDRFMLAAFEFKGGRLNFGRSELKHRTKFAGNALRENSIPRLSPPCRDHQTPPLSCILSFHQHRSVLRTGALRNNHQSRSANPFLSPAIIRESRWRFSLFLSSWPFLDTASGEIPAFCTRRSFCFLRNHQKNFCSHSLTALAANRWVKNSVT